MYTFSPAPGPVSMFASTMCLWSLVIISLIPLHILGASGFLSKIADNPTFRRRRWFGMPEGLHELRNSTGYSPESSSVTVATERYSVECPGFFQ